MQQIIDWIANHLFASAIIFTGIIQIVPIKINPWSALLKWIGKLITGDACEKINGLLVKVNNIEQEVMVNEKDRIRWEVLDFANSCRNGRRHTRDEFQHIVKLKEKYERLLRETHDKNGVFEVEYQYILDLYAERLEKNDFL